jgi:hypothetical protein
MLNIKTVDKSNASATVNNLYEQLCTAMHDCVKSTRSNPKSGGKKRHWWNQDCNIARDRNRLFHHIWKSCGRPSHGTVYNCYRDSRKVFRRCCCLAVYSKTKQTARLISRLHQEGKPNNLWKLIRKSKQHKQSENIIGIQKFVDFFSDKFSECKNETEFNTHIKDDVQSKVDILTEKSQSGFKDIIISQHMICRFIKNQG